MKILRPHTISRSNQLTNNPNSSPNPANIASPHKTVSPSKTTAPTFTPNPQPHLGSATPQTCTKVVPISWPSSAKTRVALWILMPLMMKRRKCKSLIWISLMILVRGLVLSTFPIL